MPTTTENPPPLSTSAAENQYRYAAQLAQDAGHAAERGRELFQKYSYQAARKIEWDRTIAPQRATVLAFIILFPIIAVVEYLFSEELYRDVLPKFPWAMGLIFAVLAVVIAELLVYRFFEVKRQWKSNELKRSERWAHYPEPIINKQVKKITHRQLIIGLILFVIMVGILSYMSWDRVNRLRGAGVRTESFGPIDLLPVILYIFEVFTGMFIWYIILRLFLGITVRSLKKKFHKSVDQCSELTIDAVQAFNKAEENGYDVFKNPVMRAVQEAFGRNGGLAESSGIEYISKLQTGTFPVKVKLLEMASKQPVSGNVRVITNYKFGAAKGAHNGDLDLNIESFLSVNPQSGNRTTDSIRTIEVEYQGNGDTIKKKREVVIDLDHEGPHVVYV